MESNHDKNNEAFKKPSEIETVDSLIEKKKTERQTEGQEAVMQSAEGIQTEVADVMAGVDTPKEKISERVGESGEHRDISGSGQPADSGQTSAAAAFAARRGLPRQEVMVKKIRTAIQAQIKQELKKARALQKDLDRGSAQEYSTHIAKVRRLQETLRSLATRTFEAIKNLYQRYFRPDGRRKSFDEL